MFGTVTVLILVILLDLWWELRSVMTMMMTMTMTMAMIMMTMAMTDNHDNIKVVMPGFPVQTLGSHQPPPYSPSRYKG